MSKPANDIVSKSWASSAHKILTGNTPDITSLFTKLLTIGHLEKQGMKTNIAKERIDAAYITIVEAVKYGWAHGINESQARFTPPDLRKPYRRIRALLPLAVEAGQIIGQAQAKKISGTGKARSPRKVGQVDPGHTTEATALLTP